MVATTIALQKSTLHVGSKRREWINLLLRGRSETFALCGDVYCQYSSTCSTVTWSRNQTEDLEAPVHGNILALVTFGQLQEVYEKTELEGPPMEMMAPET